MGRLEEALTVLDRAHTLDPSDASAAGQPGTGPPCPGPARGGARRLDRAVALWPEYAWALVRRSRVRTVLGDPVGALADLDRAEELNPRAARDGGGAGRGVPGDGPVRGGRRLLRTGAGPDPEYAWAHGSRALALEALGRLPEARADLDRALELDPGYAWARAQRERLGAC